MEIFDIDFSLDPHISAGPRDDILEPDDINVAGVAFAGLLVAVATMNLAVPEVAKLAAGVARDDMVADVLDRGILAADSGEGGIIQGSIPVDNDAVLVIPHSSEDLVEHPILFRCHWHASDEGKKWKNQDRLFSQAKF
jgi:hypothetical protein